MQNMKSVRRREPMSDTQLLLTITICIFFGLYILAMAVWGGGFLRAQQVFDMLNNNAALIIVACSLTIVMICGGIDISVGGVISLVVMACVVFLESTGNLFVTILLALGIAWPLAWCRASSSPNWRSSPSSLRWPACSSPAA